MDNVTLTTVKEDGAVIRRSVEKDQLRAELQSWLEDETAQTFLVEQ